MKKTLFFFALLFCKNILNAAHNTKTKISAYKKIVELINACTTNRPEAVRTLLKKGANVNGSQQGISALHVAAEHNNLEIVKILIANKADINFPDIKGWSPLHRACSKNYIDIAEFLLSQKANINQVNIYGYTPFHLACFHGHLETAKLLVQNGCDINIKNNMKFTPIRTACQMGHIEIVKFLLPLIDNNNSSYISALIYQSLTQDESITQNQSKIALCLINSDYDIDFNMTYGEEKWTLLHAACSYGFIDVVKVLIEKKVDTNALTKRGSTPLFLACLNNNLDIIKYFIEELEFDINKKNAAEMTVLHEACRDGNIDLIKYLVAHGANVNDVNENGDTILHIACHQDHLDTVKFIIETLHFDVNTINTVNGGIALQIACFKSIDMTKYLVSKGANIRHINYFGLNCLDAACQHCNKEVMKYVLDLDKEFFTTEEDRLAFLLQTLCFGGKINVLKYLREILKLNFNDYEGLLHTACKKLNNLETIKYLVSQNIDLDTLYNGETTLHTAIIYNDIEVVDHLVKKGANITIKSDDNITHVELAIAKQRSDIADLLINATTTKFSKSKQYSKLSVFAGLDLINVIKYLIEKGENINGNCTGTNNPLYIAYINGNKELAKYLIEKGAKITILPQICRASDLEFLKLAFEHNKNLKISADLPINELIYLASKFGESSLLEFLLKKENLDINIKSKNGLTPLHIACYYGHAEIVELLLNNGANVMSEVTPQNNSSIKLYAVSDKEKLEEIDHKFNQEEQFGEEDIPNPFDIAFERNHMHILPILMRHIYLKSQLNCLY